VRSTNYNFKKMKFRMSKSEVYDATNRIYTQQIDDARIKGDTVSVKSLTTQRASALQLAQLNYRIQLQALEDSLGRELLAIKAQMNIEKSQLLIANTLLQKSVESIPPGYVPPALKSGVLTLPFPMDILVSDNFAQPYDITCVQHTSEKTKLLNLLTNLQQNIQSGRFPYNDTAAIALSNNDEFRNYWVNIREFCKKVVDGMVPKDRALVTFFENRWTSPAINQLINQVNKTEITRGSSVALFFDQLASWATTRTTERCLCSDINTFIASGISPDGTNFVSSRYNQKLGFMTAQATSNIQQQCLTKYPKYCKIAPPRPPAPPSKPVPPLIKPPPTPPGGWAARYAAWRAARYAGWRARYAGWRGRGRR